MKELKMRKQEQYMLSFTFYILNHLVMVCLYPFKQQVFTFAAVDFNNQDALDTLKKTVVQYMLDKETKMLFENGYYSMTHTTLPSNNEFSVLMYLCHASYCLAMGFDTDIDNVEIDTISQRILYQISVIVTS